MRHQDIVTVYSFLVQSFVPEATMHSSFKAQRDVIVDKYGGQVLEGTAEEVSLSELDSEGRFRRVATGWGELS
jgi:hypothetical protein